LVSFTEDRLRQLFDNFQGKHVAVVGDLMVDRYYWGKVFRVSPEAPVPVVEVESESVRLGGAANVANNIQALGGKPLLVGLVGDDHAGKVLTEVLRDQNLDTGGIVVDGVRPTTVKTRVIAHGQHVVRIDHESKLDCPDHLRVRIVDAVKYNIRLLQGIIIEDYNKGVVTREIIQELVAIARKYEVPVTVDPKFNNFLEFKQVSVFKPNRREVEEVLGGRLDGNGPVEEAGRKLLQLLGAANILLTRGEDGMSLFESDGSVTHFHTTAGNVQDVSGAGDTVISTLTMALVGGATIREAAELANHAGGIVVGEVGIVPVKPDKLMRAVLAGPQHSAAQ
jgi:D-beta-D-heptose 7-phosphate kinase/D-beta-D-heptose 1-phosphate adenosyltransferase